DAVGGVLLGELLQALAHALGAAAVIPVLDLLVLVAGAELGDEGAGLLDALLLVGEVLQQTVQLFLDHVEPPGLGEEVTQAHAAGDDHARRRLVRPDELFLLALLVVLALVLLVLVVGLLVVGLLVALLLLLLVVRLLVVLLVVLVLRRDDALALLFLL